MPAETVKPAEAATPKFRAIAEYTGSVKVDGSWQTQVVKYADPDGEAARTAHNLGGKVTVIVRDENEKLVECSQLAPSAAHALLRKVNSGAYTGMPPVPQKGF